MSGGNPEIQKNIFYRKKSIKNFIIFFQNFQNMLGTNLWNILEILKIFYRFWHFFFFFEFLDCPRQLYFPLLILLNLLIKFMNILIHLLAQNTIVWYGFIMNYLNLKTWTLEKKKQNKKIECIMLPQDYILNFWGSILMITIVL